MEHFIIVVCYFDKNISTFYLDTPPGWPDVGLFSVDRYLPLNTGNYPHTAIKNICKIWYLYIYIQNMEYKRS